ncbi:PDF receptor [Orchesella cincta]|uniref:PDF receptor n=1 Tax=Orchesella cincta TaxID=48709 RepID=A0A1D2NLL7_ORCCI|nr:PDF receptor [Orchesella cincta]
MKTLRNSRTRLHRHLFIAVVIQVAIRLTVYTDQLITRGIEVDGEVTTQDNNHLAHSHRGIDNTPYLCEASYISLEYARTAMFMWMFVEGLYLHNMITGYLPPPYFWWNIRPHEYLVFQFPFLRKNFHRVFTKWWGGLYLSH